MKLVAIIFLVALANLAPRAAHAATIAVAPPVAVTTYHYDNLRTGWNQRETTLTPAKVRKTFGVLAKVTLDDQVDAQPLIVPNQAITKGPAPGTYEVVYVVTESNTVYAINTANGAVLLSRNLGPPVPMPLSCTVNGPNVGINGTPVIDLATRTLYVMVYTLKGGTAFAYQLYALNLGDLTDHIAPVTVTASHKLSNGTTFSFNAQYHRHRVALIEANGVIYAAFTSFCDLAPESSRGWVLGWNASNLAPLPANQLNDTLASGSVFLSTIWMSGWGVAADQTGDLYFVTGNSYPGTYDGVRNIQESVARVSQKLDAYHGIFTPSGVQDLDTLDKDFGAGGVLLLPTQGGAVPHLAAAAGKDGNLYLLNRDDLGGFTAGGPDKVLDTQNIQHCFCGPSYFTGSDGIGRIVTSGGGGGFAAIKTWKVQTSPQPALVLEASAPPAASGQAPGTFTVISSNGRQTGSGVIWAIGRITERVTFTVKLYAFAATPSGGTLPLLYSSAAGSWENFTGTGNIMPVVANGKVYVASNKLLTIFGIGGQTFATARTSGATTKAAATTLAKSPAPYAITGVLKAVNASILTIANRTGTIVKADISKAAASKRVTILVPGQPYTIQGTSYGPNGDLIALAVTHAMDSPALWPPDR